MNLSPTSKLRVYLLTALGTAACIGAAFAIDSYSFETGQWALSAGWLNNLIIPLVIAPPFFFFLLWKLRELSLAHRELMTTASTDSLTNCLNRRAFTALVEGYLAKVEQSRKDGALLLMDIDHFKTVNDRFGHESGDEALKLIAQTIKANVRDPDLVARLGGEEFGVFLPGVDAATAGNVAERIRRAIRQAEFRPEGVAHPLSISIGGVTFMPPTSFSELYRNADHKLYDAKRGGRDRVELAAHDGPRHELASLM
jgi:diguanylate cyclase